MTNSLSEDRQLLIHLTGLVIVHVPTQSHTVICSMIGYWNHSGARIEKDACQTDLHLSNTCFFKIYLKNMTFREMAPFSLGGSHFLFICVRLHLAPKLRQSGATQPLLLGAFMACYLWFICEIWVFFSKLCCRSFTCFGLLRRVYW
jgi:hypothetical protein